jgi:hypothetical protein
MRAQDEVHQRSSAIHDRALAFQEAAGRDGSSAAALAALAQLEGAALALAAGWYEIRADSARAPAENRKAGVARLDEVAADFAHLARRCRKGREDLERIFGPQADPDLTRGAEPDAPPASAQRDLMRI